jgi:AAA15 family ATPase/GTPase
VILEVLRHRGMEERGVYMLVQFNVKNYKSIADELSIDFSAVKALQDNKLFIIDEQGLQLLPVASLYGNNASGKSNILEAFVFMTSCVVRFGTGRLPDDLQASPYILDVGHASVESNFEVFLTGDGKEYQYGFSVLGRQITKEWFYTRKISTRTDTVWKTLFRRSGNEYSSDKRQHLKIIKNYSHLIDDSLLALSFLARRDIDAIDDYREVFGQFRSVKRFEPSLSFENVHVERYDEDPALLEKACDFIRAFDPMFEKLEFITQTQSDGNTVRQLRTKHGGALYPVDFESDGTANLIAFLIGFFTVLDNGGVYVVDELDYRLHPLIVRKIVRMFHDRSVNVHNAQLFFSSHNLIVLNNRDLRRDEVWFVEKNSEGKTTASSLAEFDTGSGRFRADMNYSKNYLAGVFGAIPFQAAEDEKDE